AEEWRDQAARMPGATSQQTKEALVVWRRAEDTLAQAQAALETGAADDALRQHVQDVRQQIEQGRQRCEQQQTQALRKEKLLRDLDEARMAKVAIVRDRFDYAGTAEKYADAFAAYGLEVQPGRTAELARRIRDEEPAIRDALIVALHDWSYSLAFAANG